MVSVLAHVPGGKALALVERPVACQVAGRLQRRRRAESVEKVLTFQTVGPSISPRRPRRTEFSAPLAASSTSVLEAGSVECRSTRHSKSILDQSGGVKQVVQKSGKVVFKMYATARVPRSP